MAPAKTEVRRDGLWLLHESGPAEDGKRLQGDRETVYIPGRLNKTQDTGDGSSVVDPALTADGVYPRRKTQHRMRNATPEIQRERHDHRARNAPKRRK